MSLNKIKKSLLVALGAGLAVATAAASGAVADPLELNPSALNTGCALCTQIGPQSSFFTDSAGILFTSDLLIQSAPGVGASGVSAREVGSFLITDFDMTGHVGALPGTGINRLLNGGSYNLYGTFVISGTGGWVGNQYVLTGVTSDTILLYANPSTAANGPAQFLGAIQATQSSSGITIGASDFLLGQNFITGITANGNGAVYNGKGVVDGNGTGLGAIGFLLAQSGTTGPTGFFENVLGLTFNLSSTDSSADSLGTGPVTGFEFLNGGLPGGDTCGISIADCTDLQTIFGVARGTLIYSTTGVPEPASLALLGGGLLGMAGFLRRRRSRSQSARA